MTLEPAPHQDHKRLLAQLDDLSKRQRELRQELAKEKKEFLKTQRKKRKTLAKQIRIGKTRLSALERKRRARLHRVLGSYVDGLMQTEAAFKNRIMRGLDKHLTEDRDRELFDLPARKAGGTGAKA